MTPAELRRLLHLAPGYGKYGRCLKQVPIEVVEPEQARRNRVTQVGAEWTL